MERGIGGQIELPNRVTFGKWASERNHRAQKAAHLHVLSSDDDGHDGAKNQFDDL